LFLDKIIRPSPTEIKEGLRGKLAAMGADVRSLDAMDVSSMRRRISKIVESRNEVLAGRSFAEPFLNRNYTRGILEESYIKQSLEDRLEAERSRQLVAGMTYYDRLRIDGNLVSGMKCRYLGEGRLPPSWTNFSEDIRIMKAMALLEHGDDADYAKIYYLMADGRRDGQREVTLEHVRMSSDAALDKIARYCDKRWDGEWPWEAAVPRRLKNIIEGRMIKKNRIAESRARMMNLIEGEAEKGEILVATKGITTQIKKMISDLAKINAEIVSDLKSSVTSEYGEGAASGLDAIYGDGVNGAISGLQSLLSSVNKFSDDLENGGAQPDDYEKPVDELGDVNVDDGEIDGVSDDGDVDLDSDDLDSDDLDSDDLDADLDADDFEEPERKKRV